MFWNPCSDLLGIAPLAHLRHRRVMVVITAKRNVLELLHPPWSRKMARTFAPSMVAWDGWNFCTLHGRARWLELLHPPWSSGVVCGVVWLHGGSNALDHPFHHIAILSMSCFLACKLPLAAVTKPEAGKIAS
jgi:hypothetical protein